MVDRQRYIGHRVNEHRVAAVHRADDDTLLQFANAEDRRLALVQDDRRGQQRARYAVVGYGEASPRNLRPFQLPVARAAGEIVELRADLLEAERAGVLHDGDDEALFPERGPDADVDRR